MASIEVRDILSLAKVGPETARSELSKLYEWRHDYLSTAAKATVGAGGSLLVAMIASATQHQAKDPWLPIVLGTFGAILAIALGIAMYVRTKRIYREYVTAQVLLAQALDVATFLKRYASTT